MIQRSGSQDGGVCTHLEHSKRGTQSYLSNATRSDLAQKLSRSLFDLASAFDPTLYHSISEQQHLHSDDTHICVNQATNNKNSQDATSHSMLHSSECPGICSAHRKYRQLCSQHRLSDFRRRSLSVATQPAVSTTAAALPSTMTRTTRATPSPSLPTRGAST